MARDASVYARKGSPYWQCSYFCVEKFKRVHVATPWRVDDPTGKRRAMAWASGMSEKAAAFRGNKKAEVWNAWVPAFLRLRYARSPKSLTRVKNAWTWLDVFLHERQLHVPAAVNYNHVVDYFAWRAQQKRACGKPYARNTAVTEVKVFGLVMAEAVRRAYATSNPVERGGWAREPAKEKPELTDDEIARIRAECQKREGHLPIAQQWLTTSFEMALHTLCRLSSTQVPMSQVDFERGEITLRTKGRKLGEPAFLTVPIHPDLLPRLIALRDAGAAYTCVLPAMPGKAWWQLRKDLGLSHTAFHSTRVTGITRLWRAGVPESFVMRLAGHKSTTVHRIYQRGTVKDLAPYLEQLRFAPGPAGASTAAGDAPPQNPGATPTTP